MVRSLMLVLSHMINEPAETPDSQDLSPSTIGNGVTLAVLSCGY
jgi:hypothetical protein